MNKNMMIWNLEPDFLFNCGNATGDIDKIYLQFFDNTYKHLESYKGLLEFNLQISPAKDTTGWLWMLTYYKCRLRS